MRGGNRVAGDDGFPIDGIPQRPGTFTDAETAYWVQLIDQLPSGLLRRIDSHQLRTLCECLSLRDQLSREVNANPLDKAAFSHYLRTVQQIQRLSSVFGLAPLDRQRMRLPSTEEHAEGEEW